MMFEKLRHRLATLIAPKSSASYRQARVSDNHPCWHPPHRSGDAAIRDSWSLLTARVREQVLADPMLVKTERMLAVLTLGSGILTRADARTADRKPIEDFNAESDYWFYHWAENEADYYRQLTLDGMIHQGFCDMVEVGNSFMIETQNRENEIIPLCYQLVEWEQVAREYDKPGDEFGNGRIENGIEYDRNGRKSALWLYTEHPFSDLRAGYRLQRIDWSRVIHNFMPPRISANSGMSWLAPLMLTAKDMDWYLSNELAAAAVAASYTLVVKSETTPNSVNSNLHPLDSCGIGNTTSGSDSSRIEFGQPATAYIRPDEEAEIVESTRPNRDSVPFMDMMTERMAGGSGLSKQRLTGDAAGANFASIKASQEDDARVIAPIQRHVIGQTIRPIRKRFTEVAISARRISSISAQQFRNQRFRFTQIRATFPGVVSSDPLADAEAAGARMRMGLSSPIREAARLGHDFFEVIDETAEANAYAKANLVVMDLSKGQGIPLERSSTERPTEAEKQKEADRDATPQPKTPRGTANR